MSAYGDATAVKSLLGITGSGDDTRLTALNAAWSAWFEERTERTYGHEADTTEARSVPGRGGSVLLLPVPVRALTSVSVDGSAVSGTALWLLNDDAEAWAVTRSAGEWPSDATAASVSVTAEWADQVDSTPDDVKEAVTVLMRYSFLADKAGPTGVMGPEGLELKQPDPTGDARVKLAVRTWRLKSWRPV